MVPYAIPLIIISGITAKIIHIVPYIWFNTLLIAANAFYMHNIIVHCLDRYKLIIKEYTYDNVAINDQLDFDNAYFKYKYATSITCCSNVTHIPNNLPANLTYLHIARNTRITRLPDVLPNTLGTLYCDTPTLSLMPKTFPKSLRYLYIHNAQITEFSTLLSPELVILTIEHVPLTTLPDIPPSIKNINFYDTPNLYAMYPMLQHIDKLPKHVISFARKVHKPKKSCTMQETSSTFYYINETNSRLRTQARMRIINHENILLDLYMRKMMHPSRIAALVANESDDVDKVTTQYIESL